MAAQYRGGNSDGRDGTVQQHVMSIYCATDDRDLKPLDPAS
jgi:hypothetical protein